jgi:hypothetical protein
MSDAEIQAILDQREYSIVAYRETKRPLPGARIRVTGPTVSVLVTADRDGCYEVAGLPADDYHLELLDVPEMQRAWNITVKRQELLEKKIVNTELRLFWDGAIQGTIRGLSGDPAEVWLQIENADGTQILGFSRSRMDPSGAFRFPMLPPGRYILRINPDGPREEAPYASHYYPESESPGGAHVLEVGKGQHVRNVDFVLKRLYPRKARVRVRWPDGRPAEEASVHIAYAGADQYGNGGWYAESVPQNGIAEIALFSNSRIRVWADRSVNEGLRYPVAHYSAGVELDTDKLPPLLELVITSSKPPYGSAQE